MKNRGILICCIAMVLVAVISAICAQNSGQQDERLEFVVAALQNQLCAGGKTLEAVYDYQSTGGEVLKVKYVRTPTRIRFIEVEGPYLLETSSHDSATGQVRRYSISKETGEQLGSISKDLSFPLGTSMVMDPVLYFAWEGSLLDTIGRGAMADSMEDIEGYSCYRIDVIPNDKEEHPSYTVWVDPKIGCCPRKLVAHAERTMVAELSEYIDLGDGIWFPRRIKRTVEMPGVKELLSEIPSNTVELICKTKTVQLVETDPDNVPVVEFPSGTKVTDETGDAMTYVVP